MFENTPHGLYYTRGSKKVRLSPEPLEITGDDVRLPGTTRDSKPRIVKKPSYRSATSIIRWLVDHGRPDRSSSPTAWQLYFSPLQRPRASGTG
jgi:hypothetical protein